MTKQLRTRWLLAAALAAAPAVVPAAAWAQFRTGEDGHALDANNRVGSGGYNSEDNGADRNASRVTGNQVVTGNVTAGRQFRGALPYTDPSEFRGSLGSAANDRFVRDSAGVPTRNNPGDVNLSNPAAFYGQARVTPPPPGFQRTAGFTGGYVASGSAAAGATYDARLRSTLDFNEGQNTVGGESILPGPNQGPNPTLLSVSPLYGVRQWQVGDAQDNYFLSRLRNSNDSQKVDDATVQQMRQELNDSIEGKRPEQKSDDQAGANPPELLTSALNNPTVGGLGNPALPNQPLTSELSAAPLASGFATDQGTRSYVVPPAQQSAQYAELQRRLERQQGTPQNDQEANRQFQEIVRVRNAQEKATDQNKQNNNATPGAAPGQMPAPGGAAPAPSGSGTDAGKGASPALPDAGKPAEPLKITSLATGVKAKGLADLLRSAEQLMQEGNFRSALEKYDAAERVAPNNPLIKLGRAHAELGASYYNTAEQHLRMAMQTDPALLYGQYDLKKFIGEDRLAFLVKELKEISAHDPKQVRAPFLLAYIAYNTGDTAAAASYLDDAQQRAGGHDAVIPLMRRSWSLGATAKPGSAPRPDLNK